MALILIAGRRSCWRPIIAYLEPDPLPGDFIFQRGNLHIMIPVIYSLCASVGLALLYYFLKG